MKPEAITPTVPTYSLWQILGYMPRLGAIECGGLVALVGYMHRDLAGNQKWTSEAGYRNRKLVNRWMADQTRGLAGGTPILPLDMYEHSSHMDGAKAAAYVDAFVQNINWANAGRLYQEASK